MSTKTKNIPAAALSFFAACTFGRPPKKAAKFADGEKSDTDEMDDDDASKDELDDDDEDGADKDKADGEKSDAEMDDDESKAKDSDKEFNAPVSILARTANPTEHFWWGNVIHDFSGMKVGPSIPLDYCHNSNEIIGKADKFNVGADGLSIAGNLVSLKPSDRAAEVFAKGKEGIPYQASIFFGGDGIKVEEIPEGYVTEVNGRQFSGPLTVIREWPLRGVALCPYGQDGGTMVQFSTKEKGVPVTFTQGGKKAEKSAAKPEDGQKFLKAFGTIGGKWFAQGLTFEQAQSKYADRLKAKNERLKAENAELSAKANKKPRGEMTAVSGGVKPPEPIKFAGLSDGQAKFAAGIKIPKK